MAHIKIEIDGNVIFNNEVDGWAAPPTPPAAQGSIRAADMPPSIRAILARAMCEAIEKATGFKFEMRA